jgi:hypothetical protein
MIYLMHVVGGGMSGYAPWETWLQILIVVGSVTAGVALASRFSNRKKKAARPKP